MVGRGYSRFLANAGNGAGFVVVLSLSGGGSLRDFQVAVFGWLMVSWEEAMVGSFVRVWVLNTSKQYYFELIRIT